MKMEMEKHLKTCPAVVMASSYLRTRRPAGEEARMVPPEWPQGIIRRQGGRK